MRKVTNVLCLVSLSGKKVQILLSEVGSAIFLGGALSLECYLFFTSASASLLQFQICQCAKRYSAIAEASARRYPPPPPTPQIIRMGSPPPVIGSVSLLSSKEVQGGEEVNPHEGQGGSHWSPCTQRITDFILSSPHSLPLSQDIFTVLPIHL
jgi:hypothetical protein